MNCLNCRHCVLKPMAHHEGVTNTCRLEDRLKNLSKEELLARIRNDDCPWHEKGVPEESNEICYDD